MFVYNTKTGGRFYTLCDRYCIESLQSELGSIRECTYCGLVYKRDEPHPLAMGIKQLNQAPGGE